MERITHHDLHRLIEEAAEVQQVICKILRFGLYNQNPATGESNYTELVKECADLLEAMMGVVDINDQKFSDLRMAKRKKLSEVKRQEQLYD